MRQERRSDRRRSRPLPTPTSSAATGDLPWWALAPVGSLKLEPVTDAHLATMVQGLEVGTRVSLDFIWLVLAACVIATFGLLANSPAVIIGAMIISPLMLAIQSIALGLVRADYRRVLRSAAVLAVGALLAIGISSITAALDAELLPGLDAASSEIMNRTKPWLPDMVVAIAGGAAGAYALVRPGVGGAIAGVAISTALMPPLCVVGIGIANGRLDISRGAFFLFLANVTGIVFASALVFLIARIGPRVAGRGAWHAVRRAAVIILVLVPVVIPLAYFMGRISSDLADERLARTVVGQALERFPDAQLVRISIERRDAARFEVTATVRSPTMFTSDDVRAVQAALTETLPGTGVLHILWVPTYRVEGGRGS